MKHPSSYPTKLPISEIIFIFANLLLKFILFGLLFSEQLEENNDVCAICYQDMNQAKVTRCKHFFHGVCLRKWLYRQDTCPLCHAALYKHLVGGAGGKAEGAAAAGPQAAAAGPAAAPPRQEHAPPQQAGKWEQDLWQR